MPVTCLYALIMRASLAACTLAVGRYTLAMGARLARGLGHEYHHGGVQGEPLGAELLPERCPDLRQVPGGRWRSLKVNVRPHIPEDPGGLYFRGLGQHLPPLVWGTCHPRAA